VKISVRNESLPKQILANMMSTGTKSNLSICVWFQLKASRTDTGSYLTHLGPGVGECFGYYPKIISSKTKVSRNYSRTDRFYTIWL